MMIPYVHGEQSGWGKKFKMTNAMVEFIQEGKVGVNSQKSSFLVGCGR